MADRADDGFERYYTEKLWELVPAIHRHEDGIAERPGVLRAMVEIIAAQAAVLRRSQDRLWDDVFIDLCDEWAVPYLGDLVGTRMISALNQRGRRVDVAKTIFYRRRKGTLRVLEELISDISGWEGKVTESFRGLARCRHGLDPAPPAAGRFTGTPGGGTADLRGANASLAAGPFDEFAHTPDVRRVRGTDGIWNIPKVVFHLFRIPAFEVEGVTPFRVADGQFVFDPSGREIPLFVPRRRLEHWDEWTSALPWEIPAPMSCRLLGHAEYEFDEQSIQALDLAVLTEDAANELRTLIGVRFRDEDSLRDRLGEMDHDTEFLAPGAWNLIRERTLVSECGKAALLPPAVSVTVSGNPIPQERIRAANLSDWTLTEDHADLLIDPERARFKFLGTPPATAAVRASYWYGFPGSVGAGTYDRSDAVRPPPKTLLSASPLAPGESGVFEVPTSETYLGIEDVTDVTDLVLQAADAERPYVLLEANWVLTAASGTEATLVLDGLWFGTRVTSDAIGIVLRGAWSRVTVSHCTLDPGGVDVNGNDIPAISLLVEGTVDELIIDHSIVAAVRVPGGSIDRATVLDSILDGSKAGGASLKLPLSEVVLRRVTVVGGMSAEKLDASEALITDMVLITDTHNGCFRFSAAPDGSRVPRAFPERVFVTTPNIFVSRTFGQPGYLQLAEAAPEAIARGAENGSEMGVWSSLLNPIKLDGLGHKVEEYLPFGLIHSFVRRT